MKTEIEYPTEEMMRMEKEKILSALPPRQPLWERMRDIYWTPGIRAVFYQCGGAWLVTGMVYLTILAICLLPMRDARYRIFSSLLSCPLLYLVFSFVSLLSEEQAAVIELKQTLRHSNVRLVSLRMFYSGIAAALLDLLMLYGLRFCPRLWKLAENYGIPDAFFPTEAQCSAPRELWAIGAVGVSSMFLFSLLSLYLHHRLGSCWHLLPLSALWAFLCFIVVWQNENLCRLLFREIPLAVHAAIAASCLAGYMAYVTKTLPHPEKGWR